MAERKSLIERFGGTVEPKAPQSKQYRSVDDSFPDKGHVTGGTVMPSGRAIVQRTGSVDSRPRKEIKLDKNNPAHIKALLSDKDALVHAGGKVTMPDVPKKKLEKKIPYLDCFRRMPFGATNDMHFSAHNSSNSQSYGQYTV